MLVEQVAQRERTKATAQGQGHVATTGHRAAAAAAGRRASNAQPIDIDAEWADWEQRNPGRGRKLRHPKQDASEDVGASSGSAAHPDALVPTPVGAAFGTPVVPAAVPAVPSLPALVTSPVAPRPQSWIPEAIDVFGLAGAADEVWRSPMVDLRPIPSIAAEARLASLLKLKEAYVGDRQGLHSEVEKLRSQAARLRLKKRLHVHAPPSPVLSGPRGHLGISGLAVASGGFRRSPSSNLASELRLMLARPLKQLPTPSFAEQAPSPFVALSAMDPRSVFGLSATLRSTLPDKSTLVFPRPDAIGEGRRSLGWDVPSRSGDVVDSPYSTCVGENVGIAISERSKHDENSCILRLSSQFGYKHGGHEARTSDSPKTARSDGEDILRKLAHCTEHQLAICPVAMDQSVMSASHEVVPEFSLNVVSTINLDQGGRRGAHTYSGGSSPAFTRVGSKDYIDRRQSRCNSASLMYTLSDSYTSFQSETFEGLMSPSTLAHPGVDHREAEHDEGAHVMPKPFIDFASLLRCTSVPSEVDVSKNSSASALGGAAAAAVFGEGSVPARSAFLNVSPQRYEDHVPDCHRHTSDLLILALLPDSPKNSPPTGLPQALVHKPVSPCVGIRRDHSGSETSDSYRATHNSGLSPNSVQPNTGLSFRNPSASACRTRTPVTQDLLFSALLNESHQPAPATQDFLIAELLSGNSAVGSAVGGAQLGANIQPAVLADVYVLSAPQAAAAVVASNKRLEDHLEQRPDPPKVQSIREVLNADRSASRAQLEADRLSRAQWGLDHRASVR